MPVCAALTKIVGAAYFLRKMPVSAHAKHNAGTLSCSDVLAPVPTLDRAPLIPRDISFRVSRWDIVAERRSATPSRAGKYHDGQRRLYGWLIGRARGRGPDEVAYRF